MGTYGDEVINVQEMILAGMSFRQIVSGQAVDQLRRRAYIAPGVYAMLAIGASEIVVPSSLDLWFARGARLRIDDGVTLRIRGRLIAEPTEIFSLPEVRDLTVVSGRSRVIFEGEDQEEIRPEWFGAVPEFRGDFNPPPGQRRKNARALQACVHAACRDRVRDGVPLPPLTVVLRDPIHFDETIEVLPPPGMRGVLWLRGDDTATRSGTGIAALQRHAAAGVGEANGPSAAALRIDPAVSVENQGVAVKVAIFDQPVGPQPSRDVGCAVLITESDATPPSRHVFFDDAGLVGGRAAIVKIADETARPPVPGAPARATRYGFRNCSFDLDDSSTSSAGAALDLDLTQDAMVTVTGGVIFQVAETPLTRIDTDAGVVVRGASVLVRGVSIHLTEGPRPSREGSGTSSARPDGQDFWVTAGRRSSGSHLTVMHLDSQSWWLLGATPLLDSGAVGAVSLVNVGAGNINWDAGPVASVRPSESTTDPTQARALTDPPTIAWAGGELPLLLAGCSFKRYVTMPPGAQKRVADVGTVFTLPLGASESAWWLSPDAIPQPRRRAVPLGDAREGNAPTVLGARGFTSRNGRSVNSYEGRRRLGERVSRRIPRWTSYPPRTIAGREPRTGHPASRGRRSGPALAGTRCRPNARAPPEVAKRGAAVACSAPMKGKLVEVQALRPDRRSWHRPRGEARGVREPRARLSAGRALVVCSDGRVLDAFGEARHFAPSFTYVRAPGSLEVERVVEDVAPPLAVRPSRPVVLCARARAYSPPSQGLPQKRRAGDLRLIDCALGTELERYPLQSPCVWIDDDRFVACAAGFDDGRRDRSFGDGHRQIQDLFSDELADGLAVVSCAQRAGELLVRCGVYERWSRLDRLAARDGVLFYAGYDEVGALLLRDASTRWAVRREAMGLGHDVRAMELSPDGRHIAVIAAGTYRRCDLAILDAACGSTRVRLALGEVLAESGLMSSRTTEATCLAWLPGGWAVVGTRAGLVVAVTPEGEVSAFRGATTSVEALAFAPDQGALLVASRDPGIRVFACSEVERGCAP